MKNEMDTINFTSLLSRQELFSLFVTDKGNKKTFGRQCSQVPSSFPAQRVRDTGKCKLITGFISLARLASLGFI